MKNWLTRKVSSARAKAYGLFAEEQGDVNIIAIILIIIVVIAIVAIFRQGITDIINGLFDQIKASLGI